MEWISVEDRLPEKYKDVLVVYAHPDYPVCCAYLDNNGWLLFGFGTVSRSDVSHWKPLPEPPEAK